jgi:hypothetical protein
VLFFLPTQTLLGQPQEETAITTPNVMVAMQWIQPALGQAILDNALMERRASRDIPAATVQLNDAVMWARGFQRSSVEYLNTIIARARDSQFEHEARVQYVLGRMIANFTGRGVRTGSLSAMDPGGGYNREMIRRVEATRNRMDEQFALNRQANLGTAIVASAVNEMQFAEGLQMRLGKAIVQVAMAQDGYRSASGAIGERIGTIMMASVNTETVADRLARLTAAEPGASRPVPYAEARSFPNISVSALMAGSAAIIVLFFAGLSIPSETSRAEVTGTEEMPAYRKSA